MTRRERRRGQALVMVTLSCMAMLGLLGLAVDLGWDYFTMHSAQGAADAAALAAATRAFEQMGQTGDPVCGSEMTCQALTPCPATPTDPPTNNIDAGCLYAARHGFSTNGNGGRQSLSFESNILGTPPTAPGVVADYWVTVRAAETIPQLFGALSGRATASARATAAVVNTPLNASLVLLNRETDCLPMEGTQGTTCGVNLLVSANDNQGRPALETQGGILLASQRHGEGDGRFAAENTGGGTVRSPFTEIRGDGYYMLAGSSQWVAAPQNHSSAADFEDPMRGKGQPKPPTGLALREIEGGTLNGSSDPQNPTVYPPGSYYAVARDKKTGEFYATGEPIAINGYVAFSDGGTGFGNYVFYGGVAVKSPSTTVTFYPGRYFVAGVQPKANGEPNALFSITANASLNDMTAVTGRNSDAGEIFVFTDPNYVGQGQALEVPPLVQAIAPSLKMGKSGFHLGNSASASINLHGLNADAAALPQDLKTFAPVVMWQDQANSVVKYNPNGTIDNSCGGAACPNAALSDARSTELALQGSPTVSLYGTVYQPRGAWTTLIGGGDYTVPMQIIAGAFNVQGNASLGMAELPIPVLRRMVALVE